MAEAEFGGVKFKGGKIFVLLTALSTLGGFAWGGIEFYNDYMYYLHTPNQIVSILIDLYHHDAH